MYLLYLHAGTLSQTVGSCGKKSVSDTTCHSPHNKIRKVDGEEPMTNLSIGSAYSNHMVISALILEIPTIQLSFKAQLEWDTVNIGQGVALHGRRAKLGK